MQVFAEGRGTGSPGTGVIVLSQSIWVLGTEPGSLQEQHMFLKAEPSFQSLLL